MANFLTGQVFGTTEQVTNTKLHNIVNLASISNIQVSEMANGFVSSLVSASGTLPLSIFSSNYLSSLASSMGKIPPQNKFSLNTPATNASLIDVSTVSAINLWYSTFGSLATFINSRVGQQFVLIAQQASFPTVLDVGAFKLSAAWIPDTQYDNLTLLWDGTSFIEIGRVNA